jgi:hypothetical protein
MLGQRGIPQDMRDAPKSAHIPITVLTPILSPCAAWRCLRVERAMGIEPSREDLSGLENQRFGAIADTKCD